MAGGVGMQQLRLGRATARLSRYPACHQSELTTAVLMYLGWTECRRPWCTPHHDTSVPSVRCSNNVTAARVTPCTTAVRVTPCTTAVVQCGGRAIHPWRAVVAGCCGQSLVRAATQLSPAAPDQIEIVSSVG